MNILPSIYLKLISRVAAVFQVSQVGDEADAEAFIMGLHKDPEVGRMVYCTSGKPPHKALGSGVDARALR